MAKFSRKVQKQRAESKKIPEHQQKEGDPPGQVLAGRDMRVIHTFYLNRDRYLFSVESDAPAPLSYKELSDAYLAGSDITDPGNHDFLKYEALQVITALKQIGILHARAHPIIQSHLKKGKEVTYFMFEREDMCCENRQALKIVKQAVDEYLAQKWQLGCRTDKPESKKAEPGR